jgi:hypothetical protein
MEYPSNESPPPLPIRILPSDVLLKVVLYPGSVKWNVDCESSSALNAVVESGEAVYVDVGEVWYELYA